jgi:iron complex outermembrane receptor protein
MRNLIAVSAMLILSVLEISAQYSFSGRVIDAQNEPLVGANIVFLESYKGAVTDIEGRFEFKNVKRGNYRIKISYIGYKTETYTINVNSDISKEYTLKASSYLVEEVIVKSVRAGVNDPVTSQLIEQEEIERKNLVQDIPFILRHSPSMVTTSDAGHGVGYTGFRIRGTDLNRINITVDGIPLNDAESHGVWWVNMPDFASSVENIQIQRGVGTSTNGSAAFGASVNFKTRTLKDRAYATLNSAYGSYNTRKNSLSLGSGLINDQYSFDLRLSEMHSDGFIERAESDMQSLFLSAGKYTEKSILKFNLIMGNEKTYQAWDGVPGYMLDENRRYNGIGAYTDEKGELQYYDNETDNYRQDHYQLHFSREISHEFWFNSTLHYTYGRGYYEQYKEEEYLPEYQLPVINLPDTVITNTDLIRQKWLDNHFYGGVFSLNLRKNKYELSFGGGANQYLGGHFGEVIWARYASASEIGYRWYENEGNKIDYNVFGKLNYRLASHLNLYSDFQIRAIQYSIDGIDDDLRDITQEHDFFFFNPKLGLNYRPNDNQRIYFSFAIANREPNRSNFVDADPAQPVPVHETLYDYELGYELRGADAKGLLNFYYMRYDDQLVLTGEINDVGSPVMTNVEDSYRLGLELSAGYRFSKTLEWEGNLALSRNRILNLVSYVDNWDYWDDPENEALQIREELGNTNIAFSPSIVASSIFTLKPFKGLNLSLQSKYVGEQFIDNTESESRKLEAWFVNDLIVNYNLKVSWARELRLNFMLMNLLDHKYESNAWVYRYYYEGQEYLMDGFYPQAGLHFTAGIKLHF